MASYHDVDNVKEHRNGPQAVYRQKLLEIVRTMGESRHNMFEKKIF